LTDDQLLALIPENARAENFVSASNFAKFFVNEYYIMLNTGDDSLFRALSQPGCTFCENALQEFGDVIGTGGSVVGGDMTLDPGLAAGGDMGDGTTNASFGVAVAEVRYLDSDGVVYRTIPATSGRLGVLMRYDTDRWSVIDVGSQEG
jgi:hypothetical protein